MFLYMLFFLKLTEVFSSLWWAKYNIFIYKQTICGRFINMCSVILDIANHYCYDISPLLPTPFLTKKKSTRRTTLKLFRKKKIEYNKWKGQ